MSVTLRCAVVLGLVLLPAVSHPKPGDGWRGKLREWRKQRHTATDNFGAFCRPNLLSGINNGTITLLEHDRSRHARSCESQACRFVIIRSRSAQLDQGLKGEKVLGIPTVRNRKQPLCVLDVKRKQVRDLGRIMRAVLSCPERLHPPSSTGPHTDWVASVHLPRALSMPVLHVHGQFRQTEVRDRITISRQLLEQWDYKKAIKHRRGNRAGSYDLLHSQRNPLHRWEVVALARGRDGAPIKLSDWLDRSSARANDMDRLVGQMVKDVYRQAVKHGTTFGQVVIDRDDPNLVVRAVRH